MRLLVVTYYYPPSGGAGVQRPTKWAKYLPTEGVEPVVLTVREGAYPHLDPAMLTDVAGVESVRTRAPDPFGLYGAVTGRSREQAVAARTGRVGDSPSPAERFARWVRGNVFVPDARVGWVPFALAAARRVQRADPVDAVLTTGPPHSAHLVGLALQSAWGVPWVADFRDPWADIHYTDSLGRGALAAGLDRTLERSVLNRADLVLTVSDPLRAALAADARGDVVTIRNGYDPEDFATPAPPVRSDVFEVAYVGTLFGSLGPLLDAVAALRRRGEAERLRLRFVGAVAPGLAGEVEARGLGDVVEVRPPVSHPEAVGAMRRAALLLLTIDASWSYAPGVVPGKTYEYLASGRPVLGLGPAGDAADILRETGAGVMLPDAETVEAELLRHYQAWEGGAPLAGAEPEAVQAYSRREQAAHLARLLRAVSPGP